MSYCIKTITNEEMVDFLLNPFEKACYIDNKLFQKYPKEDLIDELLVLNDRYSSYDVAGLINYDKQEIFVQRERAIGSEIVQEKPFIRVADIKDRMKALIYSRIDELKTDKMSEIEASEKYVKNYNEYKNTYFQVMVNTLIGTDHYRGNVTNDTQQTVVSYVQSLSIQELIDFHCDKLNELDKVVKNIVFSDNTARVLAFEKVKQEAVDYVRNGVFSEKEKHLKNFLDKTKDCGAQRFTVVDVNGVKTSCRNSVNAETKLYAAGYSGYSVFVDDIKEVIYKSKKIYKRGEF